MSGKSNILRRKTVKLSGAIDWKPWAGESCSLRHDLSSHPVQRSQPLPVQKFIVVNNFHSQFSLRLVNDLIFLLNNAHGNKNMDKENAKDGTLGLLIISKCCATIIWAYITPTYNPIVHGQTQFLLSTRKLLPIFLKKIFLKLTSDEITQVTDRYSTVSYKWDWVGYGWYPGGVRYRALRSTNNHQVHLQHEAYQGVTHIIIYLLQRSWSFGLLKMMIISWWQII